MTAKASVGAAPLTPHPWTLYLGDCVEGMRELPDKSVDHVIMDPQYEAEAHTLQRRTKDAKNGHSLRIEEDGSRSRLPGVHAISFAPMDEETRIGAAREAARLARRWVITFCQAEAVAIWRSTLQAAGLVYKRPMIWVKPDAQPQLSGDQPGMGYESMVAAHQPGRSRWNAGGRVGIYYFNKNADEQGDARVHPTQKPARLMQQLVADFTDPGDLVCDPFAGSGTTGVACIRLGRRFLGWEKDPVFHAAATKRLSAARQQYELLPRPAKPKQQGLGFTTGEAARSALESLGNSSRPADPEEAA